MRSFKYLRLHFSGFGIFVRCTDQTATEGIVNEVRKIMPSCETGTNSKLGLTWLKRLQNRDMEIGNWVVRQLCLQGWEPFAATSIYQSDNDPRGTREVGECDVLHFKYEVT